jgi:hypothetical protein
MMSGIIWVQLQWANYFRPFLLPLAAGAVRALPDCDRKTLLWGSVDECFVFFSLTLA